jgi:hypothetical protein
MIVVTFSQIQGKSHHDHEFQMFGRPRGHRPPVRCRHFPPKFGLFCEHGERLGRGVSAVGTFMAVRSGAAG